MNELERTENGVERGLRMREREREKEREYNIV